MAESRVASPAPSDVPVTARSPAVFQGEAPDELYEVFAVAAEKARDLFRGRVIWSVNSTAQGGGVAEMLRPLLGYVRGAGLDARWVVIGGTPEFFAVTKRLHNRLHGQPGDGGPLGDAEHEVYRATLEANADELMPRIHERDIVVLHDPQPAGLVPAVRKTGARVVWRSHIGVDTPNEQTRDAWEFLEPYVRDADAYVFTRDAYVWDNLDRGRVFIIPPSIDVFSPKNYALEPDDVELILSAAGIVTDHTGRAPCFTRSDGTPGRVDRRVRLVGDLIPRRAPVVLQVSRWDRLKDPVGVVDGFVEHVADRHPEVHLALLGPDVQGVTDDPEGAEVLREVTSRREQLGPAVRERVHLVSAPMEDAELNAVIVNAAQRHAAVVVQKSLAEGFGLTVSEAMWKSRPVVASRVGGIQDQIEDRVSGRLVPARDLRAFGETIDGLLADRDVAARMGAAASERVRQQYLGPRHLLQYFELLSSF